MLCDNHTCDNNYLKNLNCTPKLEPIKNDQNPKGLKHMPKCLKATVSPLVAPLTLIIREQLNNIGMRS